MKTSGLAFNIETYLRLEQVIAAQRPEADDLWSHRVSLFCHLPDTPYSPREKKFKVESEQ